ALLLNRGLLGKARYTALLEYHVQTLCMLLIFAVLMFPQRGKITSAGDIQQANGGCADGEQIKDRGQTAPAPRRNRDSCRR
ncbi:MAG TPA: hypothetical protein VGH29_04610, partial [Candidatus Binataceae bacterium]